MVGSSIPKILDAVLKIGAGLTQFTNTADDAERRRQNEFHGRGLDPIQSLPQPPDHRCDTCSRRNSETVFLKCAVSPRKRDEHVDGLDLVKRAVQNLTQRENDRVHGQQRFDTVEPGVVERFAGQQNVGERTDAKDCKTLVEAAFVHVVAGPVECAVEPGWSVWYGCTKQVTRITLIQPFGYLCIWPIGIVGEIEERPECMDCGARCESDTT
jgi:hypothetical protein